MKLYLIRHGETEWNHLHKLQGSIDIPLNENGLTLARQTAQGLRAAGITFDRIYSSPLSRALTTAQILCPDQEITTDPRLREISFGELEGLTWAEIDALPMPAPGGESSQEVQARVMPFLREVVDDPANADKNILIATHGGIIRSIFMVLEGTPHEDYWKGKVTKNCGVTTLVPDGDTFAVLSENVTYY